jgi:hypothetical protein
LGSDANAPGREARNGEILPGFAESAWPELPALIRRGGGQWVRRPRDTPAQDVIAEASTYPSIHSRWKESTWRRWVDKNGFECLLIAQLAKADEHLAFEVQLRF